MSGLIQGPSSLLPRRAPEIRTTARPKRNLVYGIIDSILVLLVVGSVVLLLDDSVRTPEMEKTSSGLKPNLVMSQQLSEDPRDPLVAADIETVRAFRDTLERELSRTDVTELATPGQPEQIRRRYTIEKMLTNPGRTGLRDRLSEIDEAILLRSLPSRNSVEDGAFVRKAVQDIHQTAVSCRTGALSEAAKHLGIKP